MTVEFKNIRPRTVIHTGTTLFTVSIVIAYTLYPHWVTLSHFAEQWYTFIPFVFAMVITILELGYIATGLRKYGSLAVSSNALYASAVFAGLVICIPYLGVPIQKDLHDLFALLFALSATVGFTAIAKRLRNYTLGILSGVISSICILELVFLARYKAHPVYPWVWTALELTAIAALIAGLDIIAVILGDKSPKETGTAKQG